MMKRRDSIKAIALSALSTGILLQEGCTPSGNTTESEVPGFTIDRHPYEKERDARLMAEKFLTEAEMETIKVLVDLIIPRDDVSGSATEAGVHEFIEFIAKDMPRHQLPLRGGLQWLDHQCVKRYGNPFRLCTPVQQTDMLDQIAYPDHSAPEMKQGVVFFSLLRDLTATGFFTSKMGLEDLGYAGNKPHSWEGVPLDVLEQYGLSDINQEWNKFENT
jgi:hypothetical protein